MNRAERRRMDKQATKKEVAYNVKASEIKAFKNEITNDVTDTAIQLMLGIPVMVLHDHFGELIRKEKDGKGREERFTDMCLELYDSFEKGFVTMEDLHKCLKEECGIEIKM